MTTLQDPNPYVLSLDLPIPQDDGAADHLPSSPIPDVSLTSTGCAVGLRTLTAGRCIAYVYPATGVPGIDPVPAWDDIPGAPGCTVQSLGFRDAFAQLRAAGYDVFGVSSQDTTEQREFAQRTKLPFQLLSDPTFVLREHLQLPTFQAHGRTFYKRLVLVIEASTIRRVFYPVFAPGESAAVVLAWLRSTERIQL
jgi:peroxiredoxin